MRSALSAGLAVAFMTAVGCATDSTRPIIPEAGSYQLVSVNGSQVPTVIVQNSTMTQEILSGSFSMDRSSMFAETRTTRVTPVGGTPSTTTVTTSGTWEEVNGQLQFTVLGLTGQIVTTFTGTFSGGHLRFTLEGLTFDYQMLVTS